VLLPQHWVACNATPTLTSDEQHKYPILMYHDSMNTPWQQTIPIGDALARKLIAAQFPEINIDSFKYLGEGWDNKVYLINNELVFRFPRRHDCAIACMQKEV
jgi:hypothetical protein